VRVLGLGVDLRRWVDTLSISLQIGQQRWKRQTPAMAPKLTDHIRTIKELLMTVVPPRAVNNEGGDYQRLK
jgi:hypothetical protein